MRLYAISDQSLTNTVLRPHIPYGLAGRFYNSQVPGLPLLIEIGVEIISNSSGSHHELRKLDTRVNLITQATKLVWTTCLDMAIIYLFGNRAAVSTSMPINKVAMVIDCTTMAVL